LCLSRCSIIELLTVAYLKSVSACSAGALIPFLSDTARLFWRLAVANAIIHHCFWLLVGHRGASLLPGEGAHIPFVLLVFVVFICIAPTPQESILLSLLPELRSAVQHMWAGSSHDKGVSLGETTEPLHSFSVSGAVSGEAVITDADAANAPRVRITADGSTVSHGAMQHAVLFSDSSEMPRAPALGRNGAIDSRLHDAGIPSSTDSNEASTAVEHPNLVCFWLGKPGKSTNCPTQASPCMLGLYWCMYLMSCCSRQHC